jgi:transcriptional regulator with XRE-family HTH domain
MTQAEAAEQIGISRVKLNQYLHGEARPSLETAIRIEDTTGIAVRAWLIDDPVVNEERRYEQARTSDQLPSVDVDERRGSTQHRGSSAAAGPAPRHAEEDGAASADPEHQVREAAALRAERPARAHCEAPRGVTP